MNPATTYLTNFRRIIKLHEAMLKNICEQYGLTMMEATIISFLCNNPGRDTAADIVELRMLSKGNVSQGVEGLIQKSLLQRRQDTRDRRRIHLTLLPAAAPITRTIESIQAQFHREVFRGLSDEERAQFDRINARIMENTKAAMARMEKHVGERKISGG